MFSEGSRKLGVCQPSHGNQFIIRVEPWIVPNRVESRKRLPFPYIDLWFF
jgi:hypothetical protein